MRNIWIIFRKELQSYFVSPIAYVVLGTFSVMFGYFFWNMVGSFNFYGLESQMRGQAFPMSVNEYVIRPLLSNAAVVGLLVIPFISMRLFAEEKRMGTIELLATSPIHDMEIILGKWLAATTLYAATLLYSAASMVLLFRYSTPDWKPLLTGYLGLLLQAAGMLALGTFISALTRHQIIAVAGTFCACLLLFVLGWATSYETATWAKILDYLSVNGHFDSFSKGVIDSKDAIYYFSLIFVGLFSTSRAVEWLRWRS